MSRCVGDMLRDACDGLEVSTARGDVERVRLYTSDARALVQDVACLEAEVDRLRRALRAVTRERDEMRGQRNAARCDDVLEDRLRASVAKAE